MHGGQHAGRLTLGVQKIHVLARPLGEGLPWQAGLQKNLLKREVRHLHRFIFRKKREREFVYIYIYIQDVCFYKSQYEYVDIYNIYIMFQKKIEKFFDSGTEVETASRILGKMFSTWTL